MTDRKTDRKIALCIGSGGLKPFGAIPVIKFLRQHEIEVELVGGCSGGSIVSCALGAGFSNHEFDKFAQDLYDEIHSRNLLRNVDFRSVLGIANYPFGRMNTTTSVLNLDQLVHFYKKYFQDDQLQDLKTKTLVLATNYITGEPALLTDGPIHSAIMGSCSMFPLMPAISHNNLLLCDGNFNSDIPLMDTVKRVRCPIIALTFADAGKSPISSFFDFYLRFVIGQAKLHTKDHIPMAVHLHQNEILFLKYQFEKDFSFNTPGALEMALLKGEEMVRKHGKAILSLFE